MPAHSSSPLAVAERGFRSSLETKHQQSAASLTAERAVAASARHEAQRESMDWWTQTVNTQLRGEAEKRQKLERAVRLEAAQRTAEVQAVQRDARRLAKVVEEQAGQLRARELEAAGLHKRVVTLEHALDLWITGRSPPPGAAVPWRRHTSAGGGADGGGAGGSDADAAEDAAAGRPPRSPPAPPGPGSGLGALLPTLPPTLSRSSSAGSVEDSPRTLARRLELRELLRNLSDSDSVVLLDGGGSVDTQPEAARQPEDL
eukprot:SAG22_NODE_28_length_28728_cov_19.603619_3_plen_259_part_00